MTSNLNVPRDPSPLADEAVFATGSLYLQDRPNLSQNNCVCGDLFKSCFQSRGPRRPDRTLRVVALDLETGKSESSAIPAFVYALATRQTQCFDRTGLQAHRVRLAKTKTKWDRSLLNVGASLDEPVFQVPIQADHPILPDGGFVVLHLDSCSRFTFPILSFPQGPTGCPGLSRNLSRLALGVALPKRHLGLRLARRNPAWIFRSRPSHVEPKSR